MSLITALCTISFEGVITICNVKNCKDLAYKCYLPLYNNEHFLAFWPTDLKVVSPSNFSILIDSYSLFCKLI